MLAQQGYEITMDEKVPTSSSSHLSLSKRPGKRVSMPFLIGLTARADGNCRPSLLPLPAPRYQEELARNC